MQRCNGATVQRAYKAAESFRGRVVAALHSGLVLDVVELRREIRVQATEGTEAGAAEVEPHHRMAHRPVPPIADVETLEQRPVALEQLLQRIHQQALAEAARAREEVVLAALYELLDERRLVDAIAAVLPQLAEALDTGGQLALVHAGSRAVPIR